MSKNAKWLGGSLIAIAVAAPSVLAVQPAVAQQVCYYVSRPVPS